MENTMAYKKYFTMSYDDAHPNDRRFVEILNYYGIKCTFNINSCMLPQHFNPEDRVSYDEMRELYKGHEVAAHGAHHGRYNLMSKEEILKMINFSQEYILKPEIEYNKAKQALTNKTKAI